MPLRWSYQRTINGCLTSLQSPAGQDIGSGKRPLQANASSTRHDVRFLTFIIDLQLSKHKLFPPRFPNAKKIWKCGGKIAPIFRRQIQAIATTLDNTDNATESIAQKHC